MQVDWLTVAAQIVNFLLLIYLLKRFLYRPVIAAMDRRERRISDRLNEARAREQDAESARQRYQQQQQQLAQQRQTLLAEAERNAADRRQALLDQTRREVAQTRDRWYQELRREQNDFLRDLQRQTAQAVADATRRALADLADATLEARMVETFIQRLQELSAAERRALLPADGDGPYRVQIVTSFALDQSLQARLRAALGEQLALPPTARLAFNQAAELIAGIELSVGGQTLSWTVSDYLDRLNDATAETLRALSDVQAEAAPAAEHG